MPRLLYLASSFPYGRNDTFFAAEVRELRRRGVDVLAVPLRPRGALTTEDAEAIAVRRPLLDATIARAALAETLRAPRAVAAALLLLLRSPAPNVLVRNLAAFPKALWLAGVARAWRADHVHAHWAGPPSTAALVASRLSGVPWSFTAHADDISAGNLLREKCASTAFVRFVALAMTERLRRVAPGADEARWTVVRLGVELPPARVPGEANRPPVVLVAARLGAEKGHATLLEAVRLLLDEGRELSLWLAGEGPLRERLERRARELALGEAVRFLGYVPNAEVHAWLAAGRVDAVALPSDREALPVSLVEALAHGVPAVAADVGGVAELLGGGCGLLVPPRDAAALAAALRELLDSPELRARYARAGRARVEEEFAVERVAARLRELFGFAER
jgi:glycosyltransferase involved in cell wall biosynthesis